MKTIKGFDNYFITENGDVINKKTGRHLKHSKNQNGYRMLMLSLNGKSYNKSIHRLVYETFIGDLDKTLEINHINGNKDDNNVKNLEQITHRNNMIKATETGNIKSGAECKLSKPVEMIDVLTNEVLFAYGSARIAEKETGVASSSISNVCNGVRVTAGGYKWRFNK